MRRVALSGRVKTTTRPALDMRCFAFALRAASTHALQESSASTTNAGAAITSAAREGAPKTRSCVQMALFCSAIPTTIANSLTAGPG